MKVTRNIILDLLPLYLAGEASPDTQILVDQYLENDPELAELAKKTSGLYKTGDMPLPLKKEDQMEAYKEAQKMILQRTLIWGSIIAFAILSALGLAFLAYSMLVSVV
jgi:hypothetical protein